MGSSLRRAFGAGLALLLVLAALPARADVTLLGFQVQLIGLKQSDGGEVYSGEVDWIPELDFNDYFGVRGELGLALLKNTFGDRFLSTHYQLFPQLMIFGPLGIEAGFGFETWYGNGGNAPLVTGNLILKLGIPILTRISFGYSRFFLSGDPANEYKLGVGITF